LGGSFLPPVKNDYSHPIYGENCHFALVFWEKNEKSRKAFPDNFSNIMIFTPLFWGIPARAQIFSEGFLASGRNSA